VHALAERVLNVGDTVSVRHQATNCGFVSAAGDFDADHSDVPLRGFSEYVIAVTGGGREAEQFSTICI
jgi:hypothetical protein